MHHQQAQLRHCWEHAHTHTHIRGNQAILAIIFYFRFICSVYYSPLNGLQFARTSRVSNSLLLILRIQFVSRSELISRYWDSAVCTFRRFSQTLAGERTCFAQHDRITTNAHQLLNKPDDDEKFRKIKTKNSSQSLVVPAAVHLSRSLSLSHSLAGPNRFRSLNHITCGSQKPAAADYIIYFKQLTIRQSDKTNFSVENEEIPLGSSR